MCTQDGISNDWAAIFDDVAMLNLALVIQSALSRFYRCFVGLSADKSA